MLIRQLKTSLLALAVLSLLTGLLYPWAVTAVAQLCLPRQADGDPRLIGQPFSEPRFFWGRLSAAAPPYNASASSGSNLGPLNPALLEAARTRIRALQDADPGSAGPIPVDLVTASGSGLDPHISPAAALTRPAGWPASAAWPWRMSGAWSSGTPRAGGSASSVSRG